MRRISTLANNHILLLCSLASLVIATIYINPFREVSISDDWSYAVTVKHLVETGSYKVNEWTEANFMVPAYWGGLFASIWGYSLGILRFSTIFWGLAGIIVFYYLAKEYELDNKSAGLVTLCWASSPLILYFTFTFMTDIPFLTLAMLGILGYTRGIKYTSYLWMFLGSIATLGSLYTRQTGVALILALLCLWLFRKDRLANAKLFLTALALPVIGVIIQAVTGIVPSGPSTELLKKLELDYIGNVPSFLGDVFLWRSPNFLSYIALFCVPLALVLLIIVTSRSNEVSIKSLNLAPLNKIITFGLGLFVIIGILYGATVKGRGLLMPYMLWTIPDLTTLMAGALSLVMLVSAPLIGNALITFYTHNASWKKLPYEQWLLPLTTFFLLGYYMVYVEVGDRYILNFLPFCLIILGRYLQPVLEKLQPVILAACVITFAISTVWTRDNLAVQEALWKGGDYIVAQGAPTDTIVNSVDWFSTYNFDEYLKEVNNKMDVSQYLNEWLPGKIKDATYYVIPENLEPDPAFTWETVTTIPYQDGLFRQQKMIVIKRGAAVSPNK